MSWKRKLGIVAGATLSAALIGGGATAIAAENEAGTYVPPPADITATLTVQNWGDASSNPVYQGIVKRFNEKYPNVTVTSNFVPLVSWTDYINTFLASVAADDAPDVVNIAIEGMELGQSKGLWSPLDAYVGADPEGAAILDDIDPVLRAGLEKDGSTYFMPNTWGLHNIYYNTKMFADKGIERPSDDWTWEDFLMVSQQLTGDGVYGYADSFGSMAYFSAWLFTNGGSFLNAEGQPDLTNPKLIETVEWYRDLSGKYGVAPNPKGINPSELFMSGKIAMFPNQGAGKSRLVNAGFTDFDILPWPGHGGASTSYGYSGLGVYSGSTEKDLAWEFLKIASDQQTQMEWVKTGYQPFTNAALQSEEWLSFPKHANLFYDELATARPVEAPAFFNTLEPAFFRALDAVLAGGDPATELQKAQDEIEQTIGNQ